MDIAALLTPGSAPPVSAVPTLGSAEATPSAELFSDLLNEALTTPVETVPSLTLPQDAGEQTKGPLPDEQIAFIPPDSDSSNSENFELIAGESRPLVAKAKVEPNAGPASDPVPIEGPPDPPPCEAETSRKDANAEAPNAPATKQDRPTRKAQTPIEAPLKLTVEAAATLIAPMVKGPVAFTTPTSPAKGEPAVTVIPAQGTYLPTATRPLMSAFEPVQTATSEVLDGADSSQPSDLDPSAPLGAQTPEAAVLPREGKGSDAKGPKLESAPDLGIVPMVTLEEAPLESADKTVVKKAKAESQAVPMVEEPVAPAKPLETKNTDKTNALTLAEFPKGESPTGGGDANPNDQPAPHDNPAPIASSTVRTVATEKPEAGNQRPEVDRHLVVRQVADRIENLVAARPREGVTIHLEPRDLGSVTLVVKGLASALDVQMTASDSRVRESLDSARPELAQALAPRGIELRELRVAPAPTNSSGTAGRDGGTNPDGRPRHQTPHSSTPSFTNPTGRSATSQTRTRAPRSGRGVDLLV